MNIIIVFSKSVHLNINPCARDCSAPGTFTLLLHCHLDGKSADLSGDEFEWAASHALPTSPRTIYEPERAASCDPGASATFSASKSARALHSKLARTRGAQLKRERCRAFCRLHHPAALIPKSKQRNDAPTKQRAQSG